MNSQDLLIQQNKLRQEAKAILSELDLINLLSSVGETTAVGSFELGLMTWRDIDFDVVVKKLNRAQVCKLMPILSQKANRRIDFTLIDNNDHARANLPKGIYLGIKFYSKDINPNQLVSSNDRVWKIDIWFLLEHGTGYKNTQQIKKALNDKNRMIILMIKDVIARTPEYRKSIFSADIYQAVLEDEVENLDGFLVYLKDRLKR